MTTTDVVERSIAIQPLSVEGFAPFGTVISPQPDGAPAASGEAVLQLSEGVPRFYTMQLPGRGLAVSVITQHRLVTQVLGAAGGHEWYIAVAPPGPLDIDAVRAFKIPGDTAIMLSVGTWHAGPLFDGGERSFFNLELNNTNEVDHHSVNFAERDGVTLQLVDEPASP